MGITRFHAYYYAALLTGQSANGDLESLTQSLVSKLQEIFMMDHAELDFGIYRIMNQKRQEIEEVQKRMFEEE